MLTQEDTLVRIFDTLNALPPSWQSQQTRSDLFLALEAAAEARDLDQQRMTWERVRYLAGFPTISGARMPLYSALDEPASAPYTPGWTPPTFEQLLAALNRAAGWGD